jgi:ribosomal protein S18 acetylase RimI-like enzyme
VAVTRIERWERDEALARTSDLWPVYDAVFGDKSSEQDWRDSAFDRHCGRRGFRLAAAFEGPALAGFAYGYVGDRGQYWPDRVAAALGPDLADEWVGGHFEFVDLAVRAQHRRQGIGAALHDAILMNPPSDRALLSTDADGQSPAVRLYESRGWVALGLLQADVQVMGRRL